jgi:hypothetical protein
MLVHVGLRGRDQRARAVLGRLPQERGEYGHDHCHGAAPFRVVSREPRPYYAGTCRVDDDLGAGWDIK